MRSEELEQQQGILHETIANQDQAFTTEKAEAKLGRERGREELAELTRERQTLRGTIEESLLAEYDRISASRKNAIAQVERQRCSACQMMVRPQRWNEIREGAIHFCESCGRFLYYNPAIDLSENIQLPPAAKKPAGPVRAGSHSHVAPTGSDTRED